MSTKTYGYDTSPNAGGALFGTKTVYQSLDESIIGSNGLITVYNDSTSKRAHTGNDLTLYFGGKEVNNCVNFTFTELGDKFPKYTNDEWEWHKGDPIVTGTFTLTQYNDEPLVVDHFGYKGVNKKALDLPKFFIDGFSKAGDETRYVVINLAEVVSYTTSFSPNELSTVTYSFTAESTTGWKKL